MISRENQFEEEASNSEPELEESDKSSNRRSRFRLRLPKTSLLSATIEGMDYEIGEIAEHSLVVMSNQVLNRDGKCVGAIYWNDGTSSMFTGEIGRLSEQGRVVWNIRGLTTQHILQEQRRLLKLFPETKSVDLKVEIFDVDG